MWLLEFQKRSDQSVIGFSDFMIEPARTFLVRRMRNSVGSAYEAVMDITADILLMLAAFSLKTQFVSKAVLYGRAGMALYPEDSRFREVLAYALLLDGNSEEAASIVGDAGEDTRNLAYLKARLLMLGNHSMADRQNALRAYLGRKGH